MLTPEQTRDLVDWAGTQRRAGEAAGVQQSTIWTWLHPERARAQKNKYRRWHLAVGLCAWCDRSASTFLCERCSQKRRERDNRRYHGLSGLDYNFLLLKRRRYLALRRMKQRDARREATNGTLPE
jgi:transcriptional regulator with XRE-family HTH domain